MEPLARNVKTVPNMTIQLNPYNAHLLYIRGGNVPDGQDLVFTDPTFLALPTTHLMVMPDGTWGGHDVTESLQATMI